MNELGKGERKEGKRGKEEIARNKEKETFSRRLLLRGLATHSRDAGGDEWLRWEERQGVYISLVLRDLEGCDSLWALCVMSPGLCEV